MLHCLCSFQLNRWRIRQRCPLLRERSYCRGRCSQCEVRAAAKCQLCLPNPPPTASKSVQQKIKEYKERSKLFTVFQWDKCYPGWQVQQNTERNQQKECLIGWVQLTSGRLCFTWGARLPLIGVRWAVQLWCAHIEKQGFLEVVHHSQTVTVSKHHTERQKGQRMQWNSKLLLHLVANAWLQCALRQDIITISLPTQIEHKKGYRAMKTSESPKWCDLMSKASAVLNIRDLQAIGRIDCQAGDLLRWLPTHPHQLDHQFHLVARRLLQWGAPHPASNTQQDTTAGCSLHWNKLSSMGKLHSGSSFLLLLLLLL